MEMKNILHPNMFPHAGEAVSMTTLTESAGEAPEEPPGTPSAKEQSPWANPVGRLQKASAGKKAAADAEKAPRPSRIDQVIEYLRAHGPSRGREICDALVISKNAGLQPFVSAALKDGRIVREGLRYMLPDQRPAQSPVRQTPANDERPASDISPGPRAERAPEPVSLVANSEVPPEPLAARRADFTLTKDDAALISWPDGAMTVQRGDSFVELAASQVELIGMFIELRR